jgi:hypothetical protein
VRSKEISHRAGSLALRYSGIVRRTLTWLFLLTAASCTWGTYTAGTGGDGGPGTDGSKQTGMVIDAVTGGSVLSDDGVFEVIFPANALNTTSYVNIVKSARQGMQGDFYPMQYQVNLQAVQGGMMSPQIFHPIFVVFNRGAANYNVPANEVFAYETQPVQHVLPGSVTSTGDVFGIQAFDSSSASLGPYVFAHIINPIPASNACGGGSSVCGMCATQCGGTFDTNVGPLNKACRGSGGLNMAQCIRKCMDMGESEICQ